MRVNLPTNVRFAIYVITGLGQILLTYLTAKELIGTDEIALWTALSAFVTAMAAVNTSPKGDI